MSTNGNTTRSSVAPWASNTLRRRLVWTVVLVLVALGGAGLATAADRAPTDESRPELSWRADQLAAPRLAELGGELEGVATELDGLADAGRRVLGGMSALDADDLAAAVSDGYEANQRLEEEVASLAEMRADPSAPLDAPRLSVANRERLEAIDAALAALVPLAGTWAAMAERAGHVTDLVRAMARHDRLVFRATAAGRDADWARALELLDQAAAPLAEAGAARDALATDEGDVTTLDDLLARYAGYDVALEALYAEIERAGSPDGETIPPLRDAVERAQAALPVSNDALRVAVADASGTAVTQGVVQLERARGVVGAALSGQAGEEQ